MSEFKNWNGQLCEIYVNIIASQEGAIVFSHADQFSKFFHRNIQQ